MVIRMYKVFYSKKAIEDIQNLKSAKLEDKAKSLIAIISRDPFQNPPPYKKLQGNLQGAYSRRINIKHRLVYTVSNNEIKIISLWSHYEF
nr:MAG TPA: toxin-antitoxin system, toxin component, Txe/YoeB family [Caudoviricetes sp.]